MTPKKWTKVFFNEKWCLKMRVAYKIGYFVARRTGISSCWSLMQFPECTVACPLFFKCQKPGFHDLEVFLLILIVDHLLASLWKCGRCVSAFGLSFQKVFFLCSLSSLTVWSLKYRQKIWSTDLPICTTLESNFVFFGFAEFILHVKPDLADEYSLVFEILLDLKCSESVKIQFFVALISFIVNISSL